MNKIKFPPVLHAIEVRYLSATNTRGARIKLISKRFEQSVILSRDYQIESTEQALTYLQKNGFNIVAISEGINSSTLVLTDTFKAFK